jgi:hypothetical protein
VGLGIFVFFPVSRSNSQSVSQRGSVGVQVSPAIRARRSGVNEEVLATQTTLDLEAPYAAATVELWPSPNRSVRKVGCPLPCLVATQPLRLAKVAEVGSRTRLVG